MSKEEARKEIKGIDRREFLKAGAASLAAGYLAGRAAAEGEEPAGQMAKRRLGRTNLHVSLVGFSAARMTSREGPPLSQATANEMVAKALDYGINLVDTAYQYGRGENERTLRTALGRRRKDVVISSRLPYGRVPKGNKTVLQGIEAALKRLGTDHIEVFGFHGKYLGEKTAERFIQNELGDYVKAKRQGKIGFIAVAGHWCTSSMLTLMKTGKVDVIMVSVSPIRREFLEEVVPLAKEMDIGVITMKSLTGYTRDVGRYAKPSPELTHIFGSEPQEFYRKFLSFSLVQDVASVVVGTESVREVEMMAEAGLAYRGLTDEMKKAMRIGAEKEAKNPCRLCGMCLSCPARIEIPEVLRLEADARLYGMEKWAKADYRERKFDAAACTKCGKCTERCPYGVPAQELILKAAEVFS
jgi:predicted aldo/keto reductase-like oxidoreductase